MTRYRVEIYIQYAKVQGERDGSIFIQRVFICNDKETAKLLGYYVGHEFLEQRYPKRDDIEKPVKVVLITEY